MGPWRASILNGVYPAGAYEGVVRLNGTVVRFSSPADARARGMAYVPQELQVVESLSIAENIYVGQVGLGRRTIVHFGDLRLRAASILDRLGIALDPRAPVASLSAAQKQLVMIARALATAPSVLMLDGPTKGVDVETKQEIYRLVLDLAGRGLALIVVSSELPELLGLCDRCLVLANGVIADAFDKDQGSEERILQATARALTRTQTGSG